MNYKLIPVLILPTFLIGMIVGLLVIPEDGIHKSTVKESSYDVVDLGSDALVDVVSEDDNIEKVYVKYVKLIDPYNQFSTEGKIFCWQGIPYESYFGNDIGLYMIDLIPEFEGTQQLVFNYTGCSTLQSNESVKEPKE